MKSDFSEQRSLRESDGQSVAIKTQLHFSDITLKLWFL